MQLRPIRNEKEHETALAEIYSLDTVWQTVLVSFEDAQKRNVHGEPQRWTRDDYGDPRYQRPWSS